MKTKKKMEIYTDESTWTSTALLLDVDDLVDGWCSCTSQNDIGKWLKKTKETSISTSIRPSTDRRRVSNIFDTVTLLRKSRTENDRKTLFWTFA